MAIVKRYWTVYATVKRVIDGDTFVADLDTGWKTWRMDQRVRVSNMSAPELRKDDAPNPVGIASRDFAATVLTPDSVVQITSKALDQYGRTLATVKLGDGSDYGEYMILMGHGFPADATQVHYGGN